MSAKVRYRRPWMYPKQKAGIFCGERYGIVEASTKAGKTVGCIIWLTEQAIGGEPGEHYWWVAPVYRQAEIAYRRLKRALPSELYKHNDSKLTITLANGSTLWFLTAEKPDNLYGEDVYAAVIDEASRCREESWHAVRSTLTKTRGPVRIIGNVKGRKNWAYRLARKAEAGESGMHYAKLTAWDAVEAGVLDAEEIKDARRHLPKNVFRELYLAQPSDDDGNPFDWRAIQDCTVPELPERPGCSSLRPRIAWGWDLAKSVDWTVGIALDDTGGVCAFERFQKPWGETEEAILGATDAQALVDSTGVGDPIVESLQSQAPGLFDGFKFTSTSKQQLMEGLAASIQRRELKIPEGTITSELEMFEYSYTRTGVRYTAPEGMHDDCVTALALAVAIWQKSHRMGPALEITYEYEEAGGFVL